MHFRSFAIIALLGTFPSSCAGSRPETLIDVVPVAEAIRAWNLTKEPATLEHIVVVPFSDEPSLFLARCDYQKDWWGFFGCYRYERGKITLQARVDTEPVEQSIYSVLGIRLLSFHGPLVQVIGRTHMGTGYLYLYELEDERLRLLLHTHVYDANRHDRWTFRGAVLDVAYQGRREDGTLEVELTGVVEEFPEDGDLDSASIRSWPCRKVFSWDQRQGQFIQDKSRQAGLDRYRHHD